VNKSKWPDFLFTLAVRFVCGVVFGVLACVLFSALGILRTFAHNHSVAPFVRMGLWGFIGGLMAVFTVPRWQTPWHKSDRIQLRLQGDDWLKPGSNAVTNYVSIKTTGEDGEQREYSSLADLPPEIRAEIESLQKEPPQTRELSVTDTSPSRIRIALQTTWQKDVSVYKIIDASGVERVYHSLDEMPPDLRAAVMAAKQKSQE